MNNAKKSSAVIKTLKASYYPVLALLVALIIMALIIRLMGYDPLNAYKILFTSSLTSVYGWGETLTMASALLLSGLSFAVADRCGLINLGANGQIYMGGISAMVFATSFEGLPSFLHIPLVLIAGIVAGAVYGVFAALLKSVFNASEVVTTMMLNYIAMHFCTYLISGVMKDPAGDLAQSKPALSSAVLPFFVKGTRLHAGIFVAIVAVIFYYVLFKYTTRGYQMRVIGMTPTVGQYAGMRIAQNQILAMAIAGGIAGLCGAIQATVIDSKMTIEWVGDLGFDGLAVAFLGNQSALGMSVSAVFFGILLSSANKMQMLAKVPSSVVYLFQGIVIILIVGRRIFQLGLIKKYKERLTRATLAKKQTTAKGGS